MKTIYCINVTEFDEICGNRELEILHTTNKKKLEDLCVKWNKLVKNDGYSFSVREILPKQHLTNKDVHQAMIQIRCLGVNYESKIC